MSASIMVSRKPSPGKASSQATPRWQTVLIWGLMLILLAVALAMRLYNLGWPFDYDGYDEGVYWQSLQAMSAGHVLYQQIFYSQPPFFLLSTYPIYTFFGSTIWSARLGVALISLLGLPGAYWLGKALGGRVAAIAAMILLIVNPLYLAQSQILEAEVSSVAFSLLAVGAAYMWWEQSEGWSGMFFAVVCGVTLALGTLCKLLSVTSVVPIGLLLAMRLWQIWHKQAGAGTHSLRPILLAFIACIVTTVLVLLPFLSSYHALWQQVVTFHTAAKAALINNQVNNKAIIRSFLTNSSLWLVIAALYGMVVGLLRRDWRVIPLVAWFLVTLYILWIQVPLFPRHLIALVPSMIGLASMGFADLSFTRLKTLVAQFNIMQLLAPIAIVLLIVVMVMNVQQNEVRYHVLATQGDNATTSLQLRVANDLRHSIAPDQLVITDGQYVASLADRETPSDLVDTSMVRVVSGYLTLQQLINDASQSQVHAVLFFSFRFHIGPVAAFHTWVAQHFYLKDNYGQGRELWVR